MCKNSWSNILPQMTIWWKAQTFDPISKRVISSECMAFCRSISCQPIQKFTRFYAPLLFTANYVNSRTGLVRLHAFKYVCAVSNRDTAGKCNWILPLKDNWVSIYFVNKVADSCVCFSEIYENAFYVFFNS